MAKFLGSDFRIEKLSSSHQELIKQFNSYEKELIDFLQEDALDNQEKNISVTYLWFTKKSNKLAGYITLLTDTINLSPSLKDEFRTKNIKYKSLPALKIGRLCVDDKFLHKGLGRLMIFYAFSLAIKINHEVGCRFITLDAKRNSDTDRDPLHFYYKLTFKILREREKGTVPMYKDLHHLIEYVKSQEK